MAQACLAVVALAAAGLVLPVGPSTANPGTGIGTSTTFNGGAPMTVGQVVPAFTRFENASTPPESAGNITITNITVYPACQNTNIPCTAPDPGVFALSSTGTGRAGTSCAGQTFTITQDPATGTATFTSATPVMVGPDPSSNPPAGSLPEACIIDYQVAVLRVPTDVNPVAPGAQTNTGTSVTGTSQVTGLPGSGTGTAQNTVLAATPTVVTSATPTANFGSPITDTVTITGPAGSPTPTGTVTFTAFGPNDPTCAGAPAFTQAGVPLTNGTATSSGFTPTAPGEFRWVVAYSGDANYAAVTSPCGANGETSVVARPTATIVTSASSAPFGSPISDTATVTGPGGNVPPPTGTVIFTLFGPGDPNNPTCTGAPVFNSGPRPLVNGQATSGPFTPTVAGSYFWVASYSGDALYPPANTACGANGETSSVQGAPTITTVADPTAGVGTPIADTATVAGGFFPANGPAPGTITFTAYGPNDPTCTNVAYTRTVTIPTGTTSPFTIRSDAGAAPNERFTPTALGTYRWIARYNGNVNNAAVSTACNDPSEITSVQVAAVNITTSATPTVTFNGANTTPIRDTATVTGFFTPPPGTPTGNLTFTVFGPNNPNCTGAGTVVPPPVPVTGNGSYQSGPFVPPAPGTYQWVVSYSGDPFNGPVSTACGDPGETSVVAPTPSIMVEKTANPLSRPEPGGDFTYTVVVTNTSGETLTITSLNDNVYGNLATRPGSTCGALIGTTLAPGASSPPCTFTGTFNGTAGQALTDVVTVVGTNPTGVQVTDTDDATVTITGGPLPSVDVQKTANPLSLPEPGGTFTFTVVVTNTSNEPVTITSLNDNVYGNLATRGTCTTAIGTVLQPGGTYTCTFPGTFFGSAPQSQTDTVTVVVVDTRGNQATDTDTATVTLTNVAPTVAVTKTADPTSRPEPGGTFTFTVVVTNTSNEPVTITSLTDDVYGNLNGRGTCAIGAVLAPAPGPGNTYTCSFQGPFFGDAGARQTDTVTVVVVDRQGTTATARNSATVTITNVLPTIAVTKQANPGSRPAPGGTFTFTVRVTNTSSEPVRITSIVDNVYGNLNGRGTCAVGALLDPGASYTCSFDAEFRGNPGATQTDVVTVTAVDNEGNQAQAQAQAQVRIEGVPVSNNNNNVNTNVNNNANNVNVGGNLINITTPPAQIIVVEANQPATTTTTQPPKQNQQQNQQQNQSQTQSQNQAQNQAVPLAPGQVQAPAQIQQGPVAFTGSNVDRSARVASALVLLGLLLLLAAWRSGGGPDLGFVFAGPGGPRGPRGPRRPRAAGARPAGTGVTAFSGRPSAVLPGPGPAPGPASPLPLVDTLEEIFRPPAPRRSPGRDRNHRDRTVNELASGLGLAAGGDRPAAARAESAAAKAALVSLGLHLRQKG